ncbi:acyl-CoA dehydrogenase family protein [Saccharopolyspora gloriosae]|uniref:acyl-CoA dehydrogenase family protein n=1 Tax=Saccharopolyspora gloriosae TaxID=455344 RepID=UPI001FB83801|nr:acyl-CoA dehydrogenase family protein [Saccharopolyspora gloriosae]
MRWTLTEDQELFRSSFQGWLERFAPAEAVRGWLDSGDPSAFERRFADEGWFAIGSPEECGGQGGGLVELALAAEQLGGCAAPSAAWSAAVVAAPLLAGAPDLAAESLAEGEFAVLAVNADRPLDAGGAVSRSGGTVPNVLGADRARRFVVPIRENGRLALAVVDAADVELVPRELLDRSRSVAEVVVPDLSRHDAIEVADGILAEAASRAAVLAAADSLGTAERMLTMAVDYSKQRQQFGVPIASFQAVKHAAAAMLVAVESARSLVYYAAASVEQGHEDAALHAAAAKSQTCPAAEDVADSALTMHGAIGYTWEHDLHLFYKRAKLNSRLFGSSKTWNERLATALPLLPAA